jgi:hypothetical protein
VIALRKTKGCWLLGVQERRKIGRGDGRKRADHEKLDTLLTRGDSSGKPFGTNVRIQSMVTSTSSAL